MKLKHMCTLTKFWIKGHKSEIATAAGIGLETATVALTVRATVRAKKKADELKKRLDIAWAEIESLEPGDERDLRQKEMEKEEKKEIRGLSRQIAKESVLPVLTYIGSLGCFIFSARNARKEIRIANSALAAEIAANKIRRERAKKILTEDQYNELYYGMKKTDKTTGEEGSDSLVLYENVMPVDYNYDSDSATMDIYASKYAMVLNRQTCGSRGWWCDSWDYNNTYIRQVEDWASGLVCRQGFCRLNDIRAQFDLPLIPEGEKLGILFDPEKERDQVHFEVFARDVSYPEFIVDVNYELIETRLAEVLREYGNEIG